MLPTHHAGEASNNSLIIIHHKRSTEFYVLEIHHIFIRDILKGVLDLESRNPSTASSSAAN